MSDDDLSAATMLIAHEENKEILNENSNFAVAKEKSQKFNNEKSKKVMLLKYKVSK